MVMGLCDKIIITMGLCDKTIIITMQLLIWLKLTQNCYYVVIMSNITWTFLQLFTNLQMKLVDFSSNCTSCIYSLLSSMTFCNQSK